MADFSFLGDTIWLHPIKKKKNLYPLSNCNSLWIKAKMTKCKCGWTNTFEWVCCVQNAFKVCVILSRLVYGAHANFFGTGMIWVTFIMPCVVIFKEPVSKWSVAFICICSRVSVLCISVCECVQTRSLNESVFVLSLNF